ncbi:MAG: protein-disulfide reductase DsbD [Candidatus Competibacteraceae bacterium]
MTDTRHRFIQLIVLYLGLSLLTLLPRSTLALDEADLLTADQAFVLTVTAQDTATITAQWSIAEGHYLYRERFRFSTSTPGIRLGEPRFPAGIVKQDKFAGAVETYHHNVRVEIPVSREVGAPATVELKAVSQGCADSGFCYPPQTRIVAVALPTKALLATGDRTENASEPPAMEPAFSPASSQADFRTLVKTDSLRGPLEDNLLEPDQAFMLSITTTGPRTFKVHWDIADGYYLYKDKIKLDLRDAPDLAIQTVDLPPGETTEDAHFGRRQVFYRQASALAQLQGADRGDRTIDVQVSYQGCAEALGVCYPPISRTLPVMLAALPVAAPVTPVQTAEAAPVEAEQDRIARLLSEQRFWAMPAFFGFGLLLAFTPCILPMVPILSGLIVGRGSHVGTRRALLLSLTYVLAMAAAYTVAGVLAALLGKNIQAWFQNPWIIGATSALFVVLALSMFGFYDLQLPSRWRDRLDQYSHRQHGGHYLSVAAMGLLSALIVSPCVAPPLVGALAVIAGTGDTLLGAGALFALGLGMGAPLLLVGASAGRLLPRAGHWMEQIRNLFGVVLLAMALWLLARILPAALIMVLWAVLLIVCAVYLGALQPMETTTPGWRICIKGLGVVLLIYGILLLVGVASGGRDVLQPLRGVSLIAGATSQPTSFRPVKTLAELEAELRQANGRPVMLDFYADWCVSCKELEQYTFGDPAVQATLGKVITLQADVTANAAPDQALLQHFGVLGPPAVLFFGPDGRERRAYRVVGYMPAETFKAHLEQVLRALD